MKNCIVYLVKAGNGEFLNRSLAGLFRFLIPANPYPVIVFCEADFERKSVRYPVEFRTIRFETPAYPPETSARIPDSVNGSGIGYRHMCRWFAGEIFPHLAAYDYYLRLDDDSIILAPVKVDLFEFVKSRDGLYAHLNGATMIDPQWAVNGLWPLVGDWLARESVPTVRPIASVPEGWLYYNNFEIAGPRWFLESPYWRMYKRIDESGGIYTSRWGDAPIRALGVSLFMDERHKVAIDFVRYRHQKFEV
jgi:hypothetical protein